MEKKVSYVTSDGREFADKAEAAEHETGIGLTAYLERIWPGSNDLTMDIESIEMAIRGDVEGLRDAIAPLLRKPRAQRSDAGKPRPARRKAKASADGNGARTAA